MQIYDYYKEKNKKNFIWKILAIAIGLLIIIGSFIAVEIYLQVIQLNEIGGYSNIYIKNLIYKVIFGAISFIIIFLLIGITSYFSKKNIHNHIKTLENLSLKKNKTPLISVSIIIAFLGILATKNFFYEKALIYLNAVSFGKTDSIFGNDIGYYIFTRPFLMSIYDFISGLWVFVMIYTIA